MNKLRHYILANLSILFFSIFLPLFAIASVIFMIKLATYTSIIQLSITDMGKLYLFVLPDLFFYTLPLAFVIGSVLTLYRLSTDNEMVVVFSLGISPIFIGKIFLKPALLLSILLLIDFAYIAPYISSLSTNFINVKKAEAKFNLTASEFGHHFGDWMIYINKGDANVRTFDNVVLFNKSMHDETLIVAKHADLINGRSCLKLRLSDGESYSYNDQKLKKMIFKTAYINDKLSGEETVYHDALDYWTVKGEKQEFRHKRFVTNSLLSLFPLLSIFFILATGIVHSRYQKRLIYLWLFLAIVIFYSASTILQQLVGFHTIWLIALLWPIITYILYQRLVGKRF